MAWPFHSEASGTVRWLRIAGAVVIVATFSALAISWTAHPAQSPCEAAVRGGDYPRAIELCLARHRATQDPVALAWAAKAYMYADDLPHADQLARQLLAGPAYGDGHAILSYLALREQRPTPALVHGMAAYVGHLLAGDRSSLANDAVTLSRASWQAGNLAAALEFSYEAGRRARALGDRRREAAAELAQADALQRIGDTRAAAATLARVVELAADPCDRAFARLHRGLYLMETNDGRLGHLELVAAERDNRSCRSAEVAGGIALTDAWYLRRTDPAGARARLAAMPVTDQDQFEALVLRGLLAGDRGTLDEADGLLARAEHLDPPHADWPWQVATSRATLAEQRGDARGDQLAEDHYVRATALVAALRATTRDRSAFLVSSHRAPYDGLIALRARQGRWPAALATILELDASDMLRATAATQTGPGWIDYEPASSQATNALRTDLDGTLAAWRSRDLVVVIAPASRELGGGHERAYRLHLVDGQLTGEDVGDAATARRWAEALYTDPDNREAARALGALIVPPERTDRALEVLAIGALGQIPLAALRDPDGTLVLARRPLTRVFALHAASPPSIGAGAAAVLANPTGDLMHADVEGVLVTLAAANEPGGLALRGDATRARLWQARDAAVLHVAAHVHVAGRWRALRLADGDVEPAELIAQHVAPRLAILASCGSAAALDEEGWGSIAAALLEAGTSVVIATDRSIDDGAALALMQSFYHQPDWRVDPARALARVQVAFAALPAKAEHAPVWPAFSVLVRPPVVDADRGERPLSY
jgi:tetratricopeptide (TPR) repeat protein